MTKADINMLSTSELANRYGIGIDLLRQWRRWHNFPQNVVERRGGITYWDADKVDAWLRARDVGKTGRPARWRSVVDSSASQS